GFGWTRVQNIFRFISPGSQVRVLSLLLLIRRKLRRIGTARSKPGDSFFWKEMANDRFSQVEQDRNQLFIAANDRRGGGLGLRAINIARRPERIEQRYTTADHFS